MIHRHLLFFFFFAIVLLPCFKIRLFERTGVQAAVTFEVAENIIASPGANQFLPAVIDTPNSVAYFGTYGNPPRVCKYSISPSDFSFDSCITAPLGVDRLISAVIDQQNSAAYFGSHNVPGRVCKLNISPTNLAFVSCIPASLGGFFYAAVIDTQNSAAYFGTFTDPGYVCKYSILPTNFAFVSCIAGGSVFRSSANDPQNSAAYFGTYTDPGQVCKYSIAPTNFAFVSCISAPLGVNKFRSAVIDLQNSVSYFGTDTDPGEICKFDITPSNFALVSCITAPLGVNKFRSAVIKTENSVAFFGTQTSPGRICEVNISSTNFSFVSCITAPAGVSQFYSSVIDIQNSVAYFGSFTSPGSVTKVDLIAFNCDSDGTLIITQDNITDISREINIVALDQCNVTITDITVGFVGFRRAITESNITIRNVTCTSESSPFCIKFFDTITSTTTPDFISISDVTFGVGSSFTSSVSLLHFTQSLTIPEATFSNIRFIDFTATVPSGDLNVFGLNFEGLVTCPSLTIRDIFINNATVSVTGSTHVSCVNFNAEVASGLSSADSDSELRISSILSSNITYYRKAAGANHRYLRPIYFRATPNSATDFNAVEISNISVDGVAFGTTSTGVMELDSIYVNGRISAPIGSSSSNVSISNVSTRNILGETPSGTFYASIHSFVHPTGAPSPAMEHFTRVEIFHITASNITLRQLGSGTAMVWPLYLFSANSQMSSLVSTSLHIHHIMINDDIVLESSNVAWVISTSLRDIANYASVTIENILVADESVVLTGTGTKTLTGVQVESGSSITSSGGPSSSFLISNITVPSPASTSSSHASYVKTTNNLFSNVNNFYNITISQLTYLGAWTVPSNLVSSGPVVFSILDSNTTSIFFNTAIFDSNVTVSGVTCELNPTFCIQFTGSLINLGVLSVSDIELETTASATACVWFNSNINGINDSLIVDHVAFSVTYEISSSLSCYSVVFSYSFTTTDVQQITVTNVAMVRSSITSTTSIGTVSVLALRESSSMKNILISNINIIDSNFTASDALILRLIETQPAVAIASSSPSESSFVIRNISIVNCSVIKTETGNANRNIAGVGLRADIIGFERVEFSNILLQDIDCGMSLDNTGYLMFSNVRIDGTLSAPSSPSSTTTLTISNITAKNLQGQAGSSYAAAYSLRCGDASSIQYFNSIRMSQIITSNVTLKSSGSATSEITQIRFFSADSQISSSTTSIYISDASLAGPINLESASGPLLAILLSFKNIANYSLLTIENIHVSDENIVMTGTGTKDLHSIQLTAGSSIRSASSTLLIRNVTFDSPSGVNSSLINFDANTITEGTWNITSNNITSPSSPLISAESASIFANTLTMNLQDNYIDGTSDVLLQPSIFSLNSSTWNLICNRWPRPVYSRFEATVAADASSPSLNLLTCLVTETQSPTQTEVPTSTRTEVPTWTDTVKTATASKSMSISTSKTTTNTIDLPKPPLFPTTLLTVKIYSTISPDLTTFPSFTPPPTTAAGGQVQLEDLSGTESIEEIVRVLNESRNGATPPIEVTLKSADPNLGTFIIRKENLLPTVTITEEKDDEIRFSGTNLTELAIAIKTGFVFSVSPEAEARNLTEGQYVEVVAKDSGTQQGTTSIRLKKLEINRGPQPVFPRIANATFNVSRGKRFVLDLNSTFVHHQQLRMEFAAHRADLFPLPRLLRLVCEPVGNCTVRGVIDTEDPIELEIQCSDGYILNASYVTLVPIVIPVHPDTSIELLPLMLRPGQDFTYSLPTNLFISSTEIEYTAIRLATGFLLPATMVFDPPNLLRGSYNQEGLLHLQVRASDLFADSARNFTLNFTNVQPFCRSDFTTSSSTNSNSSSVPNVRPVSAFQEFERTIEFRDVCADNDNDPLRFDVNAFELPFWLRFIVQPGGTTILPQILRLSGIPPKSTENSLLLINVTVTDLFSALILSIPLQIAKNEPPALIRPLPNYTINPGDAETFTVDINQHFEDANEDALTVSTEILTDYAKTWMTVTTDSRNTLTIVVKPPEEIAGESDDARDADEQLRVTVEDPFGNSTSSIINVYVRLTLWQRIRTIVYIVIALFSTFISVVSSILLYPRVFNFFRAGSRQIKCPMNAKNRVWNLPENASFVEIQDRAKDEICMSARNFSRHISIWAYDELTLENMPHLEPPRWCIRGDKMLELGNIEKEPGTLDQVLQNPVYDFCFVRVYNRRGLILVQFEMKYHEITKGWDFDLIKEEEKAAAEKKKRQDQQDDGVSEISIDFDDDNFGLGKSNDDQRFRSIDTRISSMDVQHDEEMTMIKNENRAMKAKNEILEQKTAKTDQEVSNLKSLVQSLLASSPSAAPAADFDSPLEDENQVYEEDQYEYAPFDVNDGLMIDDITIGNENNHGYVDDAIEETEEERLARLEFGGDEKAYRAKGEYDRDLEELLEADVRKKNDEEKEKKVPTFNPITEQLAKNKFANNTDL